MNYRPYIAYYTCIWHFVICFIFLISSYIFDHIILQPTKWHINFPFLSSYRIIYSKAKSFQISTTIWTLQIWWYRTYKEATFSKEIARIALGQLSTMVSENLKAASCKIMVNHGSHFDINMWPLSLFQVTVDACIMCWHDHFAWSMVGETAQNKEQPWM